MHGLVALALAGAPAAAPPSARAPAIGVAMDADEPLQVWLLEKAGIKTQFIAKVLSSLEAEDVANVEDLQIFASLPRFEKCLSELTATKIRTALGPGDAPPGAATKHMVGVASTPSSATVVATPPAATRTRQCGELPTPSTPVAAPRRLLFDSPATVTESPEAAPLSVVLLLQAAARGMLTRAASSRQLVAAALLQASARRLLARLAAARAEEEWQQRQSVRLAIALELGFESVEEHMAAVRGGFMLTDRYTDGHDEAATIQSAWRRTCWRRYQVGIEAEKAAAAATQQLAWRRSLECYDMPSWFWDEPALLPRQAPSVCWQPVRSFDRCARLVARMQACVRGWLVRRCLEPPPGRDKSKFYLRRVFGDVLDFVFCDRRTGFPSCAYPVMAGEGPQVTSAAHDPPGDRLVHSLSSSCTISKQVGKAPFDDSHKARHERERRERSRELALSRARPEAGPRGVARCSTLGSITVFWRPGQSESVLCRAHSRRGQAAIDAYFDRRGANLAAREGDGGGVGHGESRLKPDDDAFDGGDLIDDGDDGFDEDPRPRPAPAERAAAYEDDSEDDASDEDDPYDRLDDSPSGVSPARGEAA
ncbi:hypothetical protein OAO87_00210 [bacterium]|nr:hypothetical protein [bacterium]